jgi:tetratricopeptide (TPR) repeat protein
VTSRSDTDAAADCFHRAYEAQMSGDFDTAIGLYRESLRLHPTAEAHTFLGWTYSFQGRLDEAIEECKKAIAVDPDFGNPYNDIGAYLIQMGRPDEAIPWLERATGAARYEAPHFPRFNLGRIYVAKEMYSKAIEEFREALRLQPGYTAAAAVIEALKRKLN